MMIKATMCSFYAKMVTEYQKIKICQISCSIVGLSKNECNKNDTKHLEYVEKKGATLVMYKKKEFRRFTFCKKLCDEQKNVPEKWFLKLSLCRLHSVSQKIKKIIGNHSILGKIMKNSL
jgi:hypothetical protein